MPNLNPPLEKSGYRPEDLEIMGKYLIGVSLPHTMQNLRYYLNVLLLLLREVTVLVSNIISVIIPHTDQPNTSSHFRTLFVTVSSSPIESIFFRL